MSSKLTFTSLAIIAGFLINSCGHNHSHTSGHNDTEWPARAQTVWTERHEFFFENDFAVKNRPTGLALHVSNLANGSPRLAGAMHISFVNGEHSFELTLENPARPGIYLTDITFNQIGEWQWQVNVDGDFPALKPITVYADDASALAAADNESENDSAITMLKEQQWPIQLLVEQVSMKKLAASVTASARVAASPSHNTIISSPTMGAIFPPPQHKAIELGEHINAGDTLAIVRIYLREDELAKWQSSVATAKQESQRAVAELKQATTIFNRTNLLHKKQAKSDRELEDARYQLDRASAAQKSALSILKSWQNSSPGSSLELPIIAPISGRVAKAPSANGEWVTPGSPLFEIHDGSQLYLAVRVPETDLANIGHQPSVLISSPHQDLPWLKLPSEDGELIMDAHHVDPTTHTSEVVYKVNNPGWLRIGMTLEAHVTYADGKDVIAVPSSAIIDDAGISTVFVQTGGESFSRRPVRIGAQGAGIIEIIKGLSIGEQVVTDGAYVVHLVSLSGSIPEHSH